MKKQKKELNKGKTMKEMCEIIAKSKVLKKDDNTYPTSIEIFNYSRTGELFMIWEWYGVAKLKMSKA